jgi:hypothetical protein
MFSYLCTIGWLFALCLGPWAGWLAAVNSLNTIKFEVNVILNHRHRRIIILRRCVTITMKVVTSFSDPDFDPDPGGLQRAKKRGKTKPKNRKLCIKSNRSNAIGIQMCKFDFFVATQ